MIPHPRRLGRSQKISRSEEDRTSRAADLRGGGVSKNFHQSAESADRWVVWVSVTGMRGSLNGKYAATKTLVWTRR
jgi:hypothetical protein